MEPDPISTPPSKKTEQALVTGVWQATFGIGTIVSGLIGYAFLHVKNNSLAGWRILFLAVAGVGCRYLLHPVLF
jgi:MFS family permease